MVNGIAWRKRTFPTALAVSAMLIACTACSISSPPQSDSGSSSGNTSSSDSSGTGGGSSTDGSGESGGPTDSSSSSTEGGSGDAAGTPFCNDLVSAPSGTGDDSDQTQLKATVDFWQKLADESPSDIKPTVSAVADGFRRIQEGDLNASTDQSWVDNVTGVSDWFIAHC